MFGNSFTHHRVRLAAIAVRARPLAAFLRLGKGVDFDAPDHGPVGLVFGLLVPQESTDEHLETLAAIARGFAEDRVRASIRSAQEPARIREILVGDGTID